MDTYYHATDESLLVVLHNPIGPHHANHNSWTTRLFSDVGFRYTLSKVLEQVSQDRD